MVTSETGCYLSETTSETTQKPTYMRYFRNKVYPWARATYGDDWWLQQDGASCPTSDVTQEMLRKEMPGFFPKECWPPHSPDAASMDYAIFGQLKFMLSGTYYKNKDALKATITEA